MKNAVLSGLLIILVSTTIVVAQEAQPSPSTPAEPSATTAQTSSGLTNKDVIDLLKAGISPEIIIAKIRSSTTAFDTSSIGLQKLKASNVPDSVILAMLQPQAGPSTGEAKPGELKPKRLRDELTTAFQRLQTSVVTVWSETGHGTGFLFDKDGLIMTNQHVVGPSEYIAIQFDEKRKVPGVLLAANPERDVAILWVDLTMLPDATIAPLATSSASDPSVVEGERVLTIGSPLNQRKIMTTGVASKVEARAIISDININHGNSGGPLFNSIGEVVGITTFGDPDQGGGPGISGIVRIEETVPLIAEARTKMSQATKPEARLLPVDPTDTFPIEAIKEVATAKKFDDDRYIFGLGDYRVALATPTFLYRLQTEGEREAAKTKAKRNKKEGAVQGTYRPFDEFRNWREYIGDYRPVLLIDAEPNAGESFWGAVGRGVAANYGIAVPANIRYKTDFYRMKLFCGNNEVEPIHPGKILRGMNQKDRFVKAQDATYAGLYAYPANSISPACGSVRVEVYSEKNPKKADIKTLDAKSIARIAQDFEPYLKTTKPQ
ncbi:MAG: trypsin-like peptidase domain-containing protein [Blastocatellia bacterium]|nr:trypsin-like peptidase domain-containing protein [Blastocatellia bacterium]